MLTMRTIGFCFLALLLTRAPAFADAGILLLAHGGSVEWNARVVELARSVDRTTPVEVAFGMATRRNMQAAIDRLIARGVTEIVAVPLFVSSWSSVVTATEYLLGLRAQAPPDLQLFARMDHDDPGGASSDASHAGHDAEAMALAATPVVSTVPIRRMTSALNAHPVVADILTTRAQSISRDPTAEGVIVVAHGPTSDEENRHWLQDMSTVAAAVAREGRFASVDYLTVRDDAPEAIRDAATAELRALVTAHTSAGRRVLIVPLLLSFGGIEQGIMERLEGLPYAMTAAALMPDDRLATWVLEMAKDVAPVPN